jgi:hypothetical protein
MNSSPPGTNTSAVEVTQISAHGVWLIVHGEELFMAYDEFPWFRDADPEAVVRVEQSAPGHLHWPDLDLDLGVESIRHPERFPLKSRT